MTWRNVYTRQDKLIALTSTNNETRYRCMKFLRKTFAAGNINLDAKAY